MLPTSLEYYQAAFEALPSPALIIDRHFVIVACNKAYERAVRTDRSAVVGHSLLGAFRGATAEQSELLKQSILHVIETGSTHRLPPVKYSTDSIEESGNPDSPWATLNVPLFGCDDSVHYILHCLADITEFAEPYGRNPSDTGNESGLLSSAWKLEGDRSSEHQRLLELFQQAPGFVCVLQGPRHVFELANDAYYQLVGHREVIGHELAQVLPEVVAQGFLDILDRVYATAEPFIGRAMPIALQRVANGNLEQRHIDLIYQPMLNANDIITGIFVQGYDVTEAHLLAQEISHQAAHDPLTGLYNRREFARQTQSIPGLGPHGLLYMDIDHFKIVNDRCGHAAGDALLLQVTETLTALCGEDRDLLARLGGDEFALLRRNCSLEEATDLANRLRRAVKNIVFVWQGKRYGVTLSVGLVSFNEADGASFDSVLGLADAACFLAKEKGRNRVQVSSPVDEEVTQQQQDMDSVSRLKEAMRDDRILLYGQKIVRLHSDPCNSVTYYEVLARLEDHDGSVVAPGQFIPAAERFGLIEELDRHVVKKTFRHIQTVPALERGRTRYFINLSGITLSAPGFSAFVERMLIAFPGVASSQICFEVTETAAISNLQRTAECMRRLIAKGFCFALDDFGSGMASFSYLSRLPVQFIKIDGEFIKDIITQPTSAIIVEAVAKIARTMSVQTIAESVEFADLLPQLKLLGVDYGQGYALHRPEAL
jgi:diguanylate cyclase (GGDEF)-like protein